MKLVQYYERNGVRLEVTLETKDVRTHSRLVDLTFEQKEDILYQLFIAATYTQMKLNDYLAK